MTKKQTTVEWLFLMLNNPNRDQDFANKLFEKAKEMERDEIIMAYHCGYSDAIQAEPKQYEPEQYFTETYGE